MNKIIMFLFYCMLAVPVHAQTAKVYNFKLVHNFDDNGRKMLKMCFHYMCSGAKGHTIYPVAFVDKERGNPHRFKDGSYMLQKGASVTVPYETTYWNDGVWLGIYNDALNPLPGKHEYNVCILVYDETVGRYITDDNLAWASYTMTGASQTVTSVPVMPYIPSQQMYSCGVCSGTGKCSFCFGTGWGKNHAPGILAKCGACNGSGYCSTCGGKGWHN